MPRRGSPAPGRPGGPRARRARATPAPTALDPRSADEHAADGCSMPSTSTSASNDSTCRPYALRRTVMSIETEQRLAVDHARASTIIPAHVPRIGIPGDRALADRLDAARRARELARSSWTRRPGSRGTSTSARSLGRADLDRVAAPASASARACSRKSPCSASTPAFIRGTWLRRYQPRVCSRSSPSSAISMPGHRLAEAVRDLREHVGVVEVRGGLDDRARAWRPGPRTCRCPSRRTRRRRRAASSAPRRPASRCPPAAKFTTGSRPCSATSRTSSTGAPSSLAFVTYCSGRSVVSSAIWRSIVRCGGRPRRRCRCRPRPSCGSWPRPRRSGAAPRRGCGRRRRTAR